MKNKNVFALLVVGTLMTQSGCALVEEYDYIQKRGKERTEEIRKLEAQEKITNCALIVEKNFQPTASAVIRSFNAEKAPIAKLAENFCAEQGLNSYDILLEKVGADSSAFKNHNVVSCNDNFKCLGKSIATSQCRKYLDVKVGCSNKDLKK